MNLIEEIARRHDPATVAVTSGARRVTYGELFEQARQIAAIVRGHNPTGRIARIGLQCPNGVSYIVLSMGVLLAGACLVPLAEELTGRERTEIAAITALDLILANRTSIVIAHRLSTVKACDRILVLDHGRIIEQGSHEALMAHGKHYADLYNTYFRHQSLESVNQPQRRFAGQAVAQGSQA